VNVGEDSLFQCIRDIRSSLGDEERRLIKSVPGRGYIFEAEVALGGDAARPEPVAAATTEAGIASAGGGAAEDAKKPSRLSPAAAGQLDRSTPVPGLNRHALLGLKWRAWLLMAGLAAGIVLAVIFAVEMFRPATIFAGSRPIVLVASVAPTSDEPQTLLVANDLTERLAEGLSSIGNIRVVRANSAPTDSPQVSRDGEARFVVAGQLSKAGDGLEARVRLEDAKTGELLWATSFAVDAKDGDVSRQQYRLVGGVGYGLALKINKILNVGGAARSNSPDQADQDVAFVIEQAMAFINHTTPERFRSAETMLTQALEAHPDNIDLEVTLASHLLRGVQSQWYPQAERAEKEARTRSILESVLRDHPTYLPALLGYCRFLTATNHFADSLVACAKTLGFNPWDGTALFQTGLSHIQLGRFEEALGSFLRADRFDAPEISRWTWLLGAGLACLLMDRNEEALSFIQRSLAITPGTGRSYILEAIALQRLGHGEDAKRSLAKGLQINPGFTVKNVALPRERTDPVYLEAVAKIDKVLIELGLPPG
jgi:TolB-like protein